MAKRAPIRSTVEQFGNIDWKDGDKIQDVITEETPGEGSRRQGLSERNEELGQAECRIEHDIALRRVIVELPTDHTELIKPFNENPAFTKWLSDSNFAATYHAQAE